MLIFSIFFGTGLGAYTVVSFFQQRSKCVAMIGPVALCSFPRVYYRDGLFSPTTCAFDRIEVMQCSGRDSDSMDGHETLPNAKDEYAKMTNLRLVNLSNAKDSGSPRLGPHSGQKGCH